jgi:pimeloyl-ACP methyl ester carboxylesterase
MVFSSNRLNGAHHVDEPALVEDPSAKQNVADAKAAATKLQTTAGQQAFLDALRAALRKEVGAADPAEHHEDAADVFFTAPAQQIFDRLKVPPGILPSDAVRKPGTGGAQSIGSVPTRAGGAGGVGGVGGAAGIGDFFRSVEDRARDIANFTTYYVMKKRAGIVGQNGVAPILNAFHQKSPQVRIHLAGHSFGARVVTAAAAAANGAGSIASITLLQAAYSHNGLGDNQHGLVGFFRSVVTDQKVRGPIIISHTHNDRAVGLAYPIASRLAGDNARALGDRNDPYGGMGANGAQFANADETIPLQQNAASFTFAGGRIYNLLADAVITGHSDIIHDEVARAMIGAMAAA